MRWMKSNAIALPNKITDLKEDVFKSTSEMDAYLQRPQYYGDDLVHKHDLWKVSFYSWYKIFEKDKELGWVKYARLALVHMKPSIKKYHRQQVVRQQEIGEPVPDDFMTPTKASEKYDRFRLLVYTPFVSKQKHAAMSNADKMIY